jgi:hypothetical protein
MTLVAHGLQITNLCFQVVIPSSQKSWISTAFQIADVIHGRYYYPKGDGETISHSPWLNFSLT